MIGIFDSGVGGLSIWQAVRTLLPSSRILYVADQAYAPYGVKPPDEIKSRSYQITQFLVEKGCEIIVVACNTATVTAPINWLREAFPETVFVGVEPPIKLITQISKTKHIGLCATPLTCQSQRLSELVQSFSLENQITIVPTPEWVALVEQNLPEPSTTDSIQKYLGQFDQQVDVIGLGCTHYAFLKSKLEHLRPSTTFIDVSLPVAQQVKRLLQSTASDIGGEIFYSTDRPDVLLSFIQTHLTLINPAEVAMVDI